MQTFIAFSGPFGSPYKTLSGLCDVLVCDGFAGNQVLKNAEGISSSIIVLMVLVFSIGTLISLIQLVIGFIGLFKYIGYKNFFVKLLLPMTIISGAIALFGFVFSIIYGTSSYDITFQLVQLILLSFYIYIIIVFDKLTVFKERKNNSSGDSNGNK